MVSPLFKPIKQEKLSAKIANQIKKLIVDGKLKPGDPLPPERKLISLLNVSRPSLREALKSLVGMGFLEVTQGNRTIVKSLASGRILEPLDYLLKDDIQTAFEIIEVRKAIEAWNAFYAARRASNHDITRLEENISSMKELMQDKDFTLGKVDADFHLSISEATHNKIQTHIMFTIYDTLKTFIGKYYGNIDFTDIYEQHCNVFHAIRDKNPDRARMAILEHLNYVESRIKDAVRFSDNEKGREQEEADNPNGKGVEGLFTPEH